MLELVIVVIHCDSLRCGSALLSRTGPFTLTSATPHSTPKVALLSLNLPKVPTVPILRTFYRYLILLVLDII